VLLIADIRLYREGLAEVLERVDGVTVVAVAADPAASVRAASDSSPDVIVVDAAMVAARDALRELASASTASLVALDVPATEQTMVDYAEAGVVGYVGRDGSLDDVVRAIRAAGSGHVSCEPILAATLVRAVRSAAASTQRSPRLAMSGTRSILTAREQEIARLIALEGLSNKQIAQRLFIELPTVKNHVHNILGKLGVSRRAEAAAKLRAREPVRTI
jgi:two-component system, NarL family, nitrate/nitrite response regulator NarL